jgi:hypothetical protein
VLAAGVLASNHQHLFCVRIDPAVDDPQGGKSLVVAEVNAEQLPWGPDNPHGEENRLPDLPVTLLVQCDTLPHVAEYPQKDSRHLMQHCIACNKGRKCKHEQ